ncbi:MAG: dolichol-phosphate mannosyltransferase [Planctomycetaceae bacterium]|nr:dolichol-phosphate mannosyltransferase [Planctomycetaceae bacterium]
MAVQHRIDSAEGSRSSDRGGRRAESLECVSVVLPTYNERGNIVALIEEIHQVLDGVPTEIVVVDDDSPDGTADIVRERFAGREDVRVLVRTSDPSLAKSIRHGLEAATGDVLVVMDTDFNHPPEHLAFMVESLRWYDCVSGSRYLFGGGMESRKRLTFSWLFNVFVRTATGGQITDNLYGYFAIRADVLRALKYDEIFWGYGDYCIRLLYFLQRKKAAVLQFPVMNGSRRSGTANSAFVSTLFQYVAATLPLAMKARLSRWTDRSSLDETDEIAVGADDAVGKPKHGERACTAKRQNA